MKHTDTMPRGHFGFGMMVAAVLFAAWWLARLGAQSVDAPAGAVDIHADPLLDFVLIPAGEFVMGSDPESDSMAYANERWSPAQRQGRVYLPDYYIARYEVTLAQYHGYLRAMGADPATAPRNGGPSHPVTGITLPQALAYAAWLERQLRDSPDTPLRLRRFLAEGGRVTLPSEAQWEKAARGDDGRLFPWGSELRADFANFRLSSHTASALSPSRSATQAGGAVQPVLRPVGSFPCPGCAFGLADMSGNVWEMTRSPMQDYPFTRQDDRDMLGTDALWVMRGGSFDDTINNVRAAVRGGFDPGVRSPSIGFRLVLSPAEERDK